MMVNLNMLETSPIKQFVKFSEEAKELLA
jgi:hypothetical protein